MNGSDNQDINSTTYGTTTVTEKKCTKCEQVKPSSAFSPNRAVRSGLQSWCRDCNNTRRRRDTRLNTKANRKEYLEVRAVMAAYDRVLTDQGAMLPHVTLRALEVFGEKLQAYLESVRAISSPWWYSIEREFNNKVFISKNEVHTINKGNENESN